MKVILKQDVRGVGKKFEVKNVADGYANNFLLPRKLAEFASPDAVKRSEILKATTAAEIEIREKLTEAQIASLKEIKIELKKKANEKGSLFEKIHETEISEALKSQAHADIAPEYIKLETPIKETGEHKVKVEVGKNKGEFSLIISN